MSEISLLKTSTTKINREDNLDSTRSRFSRTTIQKKKKKKKKRIKGRRRRRKRNKEASTEETLHAVAQYTHCFHPHIILVTLKDPISHGQPAEID